MVLGDNVSINSFNPIIDQKSLILILGTMPSKESLRKKEYYADSRNKFWEIIYSIFDRGPPSSSYNEKIEFIKSKRIALWDVIRSCNREGSSDSNIWNARPNNFTDLLKEYPNLRYAIFNGLTAYGYFKLYVDSPPYEFYKFKFKKLDVLPSTSSSYPMPLEKKIKSWGKIKELIKAEKC